MLVLNTIMLALRVVDIILGEMNSTLTIYKNYSDTLYNTTIFLRPLNHVASLTPSVAAVYSTLVVDKVAIGCADAL